MTVLELSKLLDLHSNTFVLSEVSKLASGVYVLKISGANKSFNKTIIKK